MTVRPITVLASGDDAAAAPPIVEQLHDPLSRHTGCAHRGQSDACEESVWWQAGQLMSDTFTRKLVTLAAKRRSTAASMASVRARAVSGFVQSADGAIRITLP